MPGSHNVWFPKHILEKAAQNKDDKNIFKAEWAAVRQFELLYESGNNCICDLAPDMMLLKRAMIEMTRFMRAGGYRIVVATLGTYDNEQSKDDLAILDTLLQEEISNLIHIMYLQEESDIQNKANQQRIQNNEWNWKTDLPHIASVLGSEQVMNFHKMNEDKIKQNKLGRQFFNVIEKLPQNHIVHDTAIGLQLPELIGENQWIYLVSAEESFASFCTALNFIFDKFDHISMSHLHDLPNGKSEVCPTTLHMRSYGDRLNERNDNMQKAIACCLG